MDNTLPQLAERRVLARATEIFGDSQQAEYWLRSENLVLDGQTPQSMLGTIEGIREVWGLLTIMEMFNAPPPAEDLI